MKSKAPPTSTVARQLQPLLLSSKLVVTGIWTAGLALLTVVLALTALENKETSRGQTIQIRHLEVVTLRECEALIVHNPDAEHVLRALRAAPQGHGG